MNYCMAANCKSGSTHWYLIERNNIEYVTSYCNRHELNLDLPKQFLSLWKRELTKDEVDIWEVLNS